MGIRYRHPIKAPIFGLVIQKQVFWPIQSELLVISARGLLLILILMTFWVQRESRRGEGFQSITLGQSVTVQENLKETFLEPFFFYTGFYTLVRSQTFLVKYSDL